MEKFLMAISQKGSWKQELRTKIQTNAPFFDEILNRNSNNFNLLRLILACLVIYGHSFPIQRTPSGGDFALNIFGFDYTGGFAVKTFFFLSGVFVTESMQERGSILPFAVKRITRIYPALIVCLLLSVFILGPMFTTYPLDRYFSDPDTISYFYRNLSLGDLQWRLPGVFAKSPVGLNGSLWTLPVEIRLYAAVALFYLMGSMGHGIKSSGLSLTLRVFNMWCLERLGVIEHIANI